jgi:hypothetical protein
MSRTLPDGGTKLQKMFSDLYVNAYGGNPPSAMAAEKAIHTGLLQSGSTKLDVRELVEQAKKMFAEGLVRKVGSNILNGTDITYSDIGEVCFGGRVFSPTANPDGKSVKTYFEDYFMSISPNTTFVQPSINMIPAGMVIKAFQEFKDNL